MPTRTIELTPDLDSFISAEVERGGFQSANPVITTAVQMLQEHRLRSLALDAAIDAGAASGVAAGDVFGRVTAARSAREAGRLEKTKVA